MRKHQEGVWSGALSLLWDGPRFGRGRFEEWEKTGTGPSILFFLVK